MAASQTKDKDERERDLIEAVGLKDDESIAIVIQLYTKTRLALEASNLVHSSQVDMVAAELTKIMVMAGGSNIKVKS